MKRLIGRGEGGGKEEGRREFSQTRGIHHHLLDKNSINGGPGESLSLPEKNERSRIGAMEERGGEGGASYTGKEISRKSGDRVVIVPAGLRERLQNTVFHREGH